MSAESHAETGVESAIDILAVALASAKRRAGEAITDISEREFHWEPLSASERSADIILAPDRKKVWRVYQREGVWSYDYTPEALDSSPFTTIAWIMNHIAQTGDMYLYCIKTGKPEGVDRNWDDLPVYPDHTQTSRYLFRVLDDTQNYLDSIARKDVSAELNRRAPAPWGEMRPAYRNVWGGIIAHTIEHAAQIAVLKGAIRFGYW